MDQLCTIYRSLILVKFMSMFVCNTTGVKVNNFCCHLPLSQNTHLWIPQPKNFWDEHYFHPKVTSLSKMWDNFQQIFGIQEKFLLKRKEDFNIWDLTIYWIYIVWPTSVLLNWPINVWHTYVQTKLPFSRCLPTTTIFITTFQMCSLDLRFNRYYSLIW